ncbi:MAG: hypothetical protein K2P79_03765, partial [Sphingomonas sp.]|nr:hypothetical protein [Sphingomonas sp.]
PETAQGQRVSRLTFDPEIELTVNKLPGDVNQLDGVLILLIDKTGAAIDCAVKQYQDNTPLPEKICAYKSEIVQDIKLDKAGSPVQYVIEMRVRLKLTG